jgi:acetyl-CoA carboxylase biotin carboxyl carrier protein
MGAWHRVDMSERTPQGNHSVSREDIDALVEIFESSSWNRLDFVLGDVELHISKSASQSSHSEVARAAVREASTQAGTKPLLEIRAPHLATFCRAPKPGAPPYIEIGQEVTADTEVGLLEVMKRFTPLRAGLRGIVREIRVTDSTLVEFGQTLFLVEPEG